ncbi:MAG: C39 family peptidase [Methanobacterium sp.]|jgi:predicted double-glycine peptidase
MKKYIAVLLVALIIGVTPAVAAEYSEITQTADLAVKGKGADVASASELVEAVESGKTTGIDNETFGTNANVSSTESATVENTTTSDNLVSVDDQATSTDMQVPDLNGTSEDYVIENITIPQIDTSGIVMQSTDYSCGPAALATVLQNMGINSTEGDLKVLAGTDTSGTTMHGLSEAAKAKGLSATGMKLSVDDLKPNNIVHIILDGEGHYSVIREVSENSVYLADPSLGNIEMSREEFSAIFTGNVLVITDPNMQVNQTETSNQTNITDTSIVQPENSQTLAAETMQDIRGRVIWKFILAAIAAKKVWAIKMAAKIAKHAWKSGVRGRELAGTIKRAILKRVPFNDRQRVQKAALAGASALYGYTVTNRDRWCLWTAIAVTKGPFWMTLVFGR